MSSSRPDHELSKVGDRRSWVEPGYVGTTNSDGSVYGDPAAKPRPAAERLQSPLIQPAVDAGNRLALEALNDGITKARRNSETKTDSGPSGILLGGAAFAGFGLGAIERPRYALGAVAAAVTIDLGRRLFVAGTSAWDAYKNPRNRDVDDEKIAEVFSAASLKYPAELGFAALAGVVIGRIGRNGLATMLSHPSVEQRALVPSDFARDDAARLAKADRQIEILDTVFREKFDLKDTVTIPVFRGDELEFKPDLLYADPTSGLGLFYENMRKPVVRVVADKTGPLKPGESEGADSSGFLISDTLGVSNKHAFAGFDSVSVESLDGHQFPATVVAVDDAADLLMFRLLNKPADVAVPHFQLAASSELPKGSFVATINHVTGTSEDVLAMGQIKGGVLTSNVDNNSNGEYIGRILSDVPMAEGSSGSGLLNQSGELIAVNAAIVGRAAFSTRVEHLQIMKELVEMQPPPPGQYYVLTTTFDQNRGLASVVRIETSADKTFGGQQGDFVSSYGVYADLDSENFVKGEYHRGHEILKLREAQDRNP